MCFNRCNRLQHADFCLCVDNILEIRLGVVDDLLELSFSIRAGDTFGLKQQISNLIAVCFKYLFFASCAHKRVFFALQCFRRFFAQTLCFFFSRSLNAVNFAFFAFDTLTTKLVFPKLFHLLLVRLGNFFKFCSSFLSSFKRCSLSVSVFLSLLVSKRIGAGSVKNALSAHVGKAAFQHF